MYALTLAALVLVGGLAFPVSSSAQTGPLLPKEMSGYAWAPNFGYVYFGPNNNVSVRVLSDGSLAGFAWSRNLGWILFHPGLTGPIGTGDSGARLVLSGTQYAIRGYFRACNAYVSGCQSIIFSGKTESQIKAMGPLVKSLPVKTLTGTELGGWDGWFKAFDVGYAPFTKRYTGSAWGSLVGGWLNMSTLMGFEDFTATCEASYDDPAPPPSPAVVKVTPVTWSVKLSGDSVGPYTYAWYEAKGAAPETILGTKTTDTKPLVTKIYQTTGTYYRKTVVTDSSNPPRVAEGVCSVGEGTSGGSGGGSGVTVTGESECKITVKYNDPSQIDKKTNEVVDAGLGVQFLSDNETKKFTCGTQINLTAFSPVSPATKKAIRWTGCSASSDKKSCQTAALKSGTLVVNADFRAQTPESAEITLKNSLNVFDNIVNVDRPASYPAYSRSLRGVRVVISGTTEDVPVNIGLSELETARASATGLCDAPKLCFKRVDVAGEYDCHLADPARVTLTGGQEYYVRFEFPKKCAAASGYSVFHRPAGYWNIPLSLENGASESLLLLFNDPSVTPQ